MPMLTFSAPGPYSSFSVATIRVFLPAPDGPYTRRCGKSPLLAWLRMPRPLGQPKQVSRMLLRTPGDDYGHDDDASAALGLDQAHALFCSADVCVT